MFTGTMEEVGMRDIAQKLLTGLFHFLALLTFSQGFVDRQCADAREWGLWT